MAIQGIIFGFVNPSKPECNMLLLGRGEAYELVIDGERVDVLAGELDPAIRYFKQRALIHCASDWVDVRGTVTDAMGHLRVTEWGTATFENSISYIAVDHDGGSDAPPASRERG